MSKLWLALVFSAFICLFIDAAPNTGTGVDGLDESEKYLLSVVQHLMNRHSRKNQLLEKTKTDIQTLLRDIDELEKGTSGSESKDELPKRQQQRSSNDTRRSKNGKSNDEWVQKKISEILNDLQVKRSTSSDERIDNRSKLNRYADTPLLGKFYRYGDDKRKIR